MTASVICNSIWRDRSWSPDPGTARLAANEESDLVVVGGGFLGLSAALHAARRGLSVRVLDAGEIGAAASGLNGGQVIAGFKYDPDWLLEHFGAARGEALIRFASEMPDSVFGLIEQERLDVPHMRTGWIQAAHTQGAAEASLKRARQWQARGVDARVLSQSEAAEATGAEGYVGGWIDPRGGVIHPLAFTLELARLAEAAGAKIATKVRATRLSRRNGSWTVETADGTPIKAGKVIVGTNAYTDGLVPGLASTLLPLHSFQIATAPLPAAARASILPGGHAVSDSRRIVVYYRKSPDGRLMFGGRGRMAEPRNTHDWSHLERALARLFPALGGIPVEKRWFGRVAMTLDHLPHVHEPEPGLVAAVGCQGRGIGLMTAMGPRLVDYLLSGDQGSLPIPVTPIQPIPLHRFRHIGIGAAIAWYRMIDALGY